MADPHNNSFVMYDEEFQRISAVIEKLLRESNSKVIFLVDKNGQMIASCGETGDLDTTSLASLTAGNIAATGGLAKLIGEKEFSILFHEGEKDNIHISIIASRVILVVASLPEHRVSRCGSRLMKARTGKLRDTSVSSRHTSSSRPNKTPDTGFASSDQARNKPPRVQSPCPTAFTWWTARHPK